MAPELICCRPSGELLEAYLEFCRECWGHIHDSYLLNDPACFEEWRKTLPAELAAHEAGRDLAPGLMPSARFWIMAGNTMVGAADIRLKLNDALKDYGGHLGLVIRPSARGQGYSKKINSLLLAEAVRLKLPELLITCVAENHAARQSLRSIPGIREETGEAVFQGKRCRVCRFYWRPEK